jgi:hypothetical protein
LDHPTKGNVIFEGANSVIYCEQLSRTLVNSTLTGGLCQVTRSLTIAILITGFLASSTGSFCQGPHATDPSHELDEMTKRYKLDPNQRSEVKTILMSEAEDLQTISSDSDLSPNQREHKVADLRRVCNREIEAILHDEQRLRFDHDQKVGY